MRIDYALYVVAIVFFIVTGILCAYQWYGYMAITAILGLIFAGIGYIQRLKITKTTVVESTQPITPVVPTTTITPPTPSTTTEEEKIPQEVAPTKAFELTDVRGIGVKRAEQLKSIGITRVEDLAKASAEDLASKLKVSPKITGKWIEEAKKLLEKQ